MGSVPYLVLARKWRPRGFEELVGQEHVARALKNAIAQDRVAHAFLFTGARGVGKTSAARVLARALNCVKGPTPTPCAECDRCQEITAGTAVDVLEIDAASNRGIDDIRTLRESVRYLPAVAKRKVVIVDEVHMLTPEAFNALLKTLEEPPPHVVFVLATTDPHKVPVTILSRCQRYDFKRVGIAPMVEHLGMILGKEGLPVARAGLVLLARESEGSVRDALSLLDQVLSYAGTGGQGEVGEQAVAEVLGVADHALISSLGEALCGRDVAAALKGVAEGFDRGYDMAQLSRALLGHIRDLTVVKLVREPSALVELSADEIERMRGVVASVDASLIEQHFHYLARAVEDVARSPDPRATLEMALVRIARAEPLVALTELLERIDALASGAPPPAGGSRPSSTGAPPPRPTPAAPRTASAAAAAVASPAPAAAPVPTPTPAPAPPARAAAPPAPPAQAAASPAPAPAVVAVATPAPSPADPDLQSLFDQEPVPDLEDEEVDDSLFAPPARPVPKSVEAPSSGCVEARMEPPPPAPEVRPEPVLVGGLPTWERIVAALRDRKPSLAAILEEATLISLDARRLVLGFARGSFVHAQAVDKDNQAALKSFARSQLGDGLELEIRDLTPKALAAAALAQNASTPTASVTPEETAPIAPAVVAPVATLVDLDRRRQDDERERRKREAREHPLVRAAQEKFGAEIKDIKTDLE